MDRPFDDSIKDGQMDRPFDDPDRNMRDGQMDRPFDYSIKDGQMDKGRTDGQAF
jgi:hypothetical protein